MRHGLLMGALCAVVLAGCGAGSRTRPTPTLKDPLASAQGARPDHHGNRAAHHAAHHAGVTHARARTAHHAHHAHHAAHRAHHAASLRHASRGAPPARPAAPHPSNHVRRVGPLTVSDRQRIAAARSTIVEFVRLAGAGDPALCTRVFTLHHVETVTGLQGSAALAKCRKDTQAEKVPIRLNRIEGVRILPAYALVQFTSSIGNLAKRQILKLVREGGRYKIDGDGSSLA